MRRLGRALGPGVAVLWLCSALWAQEAPPLGPVLNPGPPPANVPVLTLDQDRWFAESRYGAAAIARAEADTTALSAENQRIETALEAEERDLTARRATLSATDFAPLAEAFDTKVEEIRTAQDTKARAITRQLEDSRRAFYEAALPLLGGLLDQYGAVAILDNSAVILSLTSIDVTADAVLRVDAVLAPPAP